MTRRSRRVLFTHDGPLYVDKAGEYYGVHFTDTIRKRYLMLGESVTFLMRVRALEGASWGMSAISNDRFRVIGVPDFKGVMLFLKNYRKAKLIVWNAVAEHDIVVVRMPSAISGIAIEAALKTGKPILAEFVGCTFDAYWNYNWKGKLIAHYKMKVQRRLVRKLPYIVYVTKQFLQRRYPSPAKQISCSNVELHETEPALLQRKVERLDRDDINSTLVVGTVAALDVPYKGQADVIRAISFLKKRGVRIRYLLIGQGSQDRLQRVIRDNNVEDLVSILGPRRHEEIFGFYDDLDLYIQPSKQEGLPRALIEAMSRGCPCLGAATAGIPELLRSDYVFKPGSVLEIAEKILMWDKKTLIAEAKRNFRESMDYRSSVLNQRRQDFYELFLKDLDAADTPK